MEVAAFEKAFSDIVSHNNSDGPSRNIFEPKFEAREQMLQLRRALLNVQKEEGSQMCQQQLCRTYLFHAMNLFETEEDKDALSCLLMTHAIAKSCVTKKEYNFFASDENLERSSLDEILRLDHPLCDEHQSFCAADVYIDVLNNIGIYLSSRHELRERMNDARKVLHDAETCYLCWEKWWGKKGKCSKAELNINDDGSLRLPQDQSNHTELVFRKKMDDLYMSTIYYLAQAYGVLGLIPQATKYCHATMVEQVKCKKDFSRKEWATNAVHLSGFYNSIGAFGPSEHCLNAARIMMPSENPDEETLGVVAWGFAKMHKARLQAAVSGNKVMMTSDFLLQTPWWTDFPIPGLPSPSDANLPPITNFESAREVFKAANKECQEASKWYAYETCCPDYIAIQQDVSSLYSLLDHFEPDLERKILMHERRVDLLKKFPSDLALNAYATLIRQLMYDIGEIVCDILDLRIKQAHENGPGKPFSVKKMHELNLFARKWYEDFIETFKEKGVLPKKLDKETKVPIFRAMMRLARLENRLLFKTPQDEYDCIGRTIQRYNEVLQFADDQEMTMAEVQQEVSLAKEMVALLPGKQKEVWKVYNGGRS